MITRLYAYGGAASSIHFFYNALCKNSITKTLGGLAILFDLIRNNLEGDIETLMRATEGAITGVVSHALLTYLMESAGFTIDEAIKINSTALSVTAFVCAKALEYRQSVANNFPDVPRDPENPPIVRLQPHRP